MSPIKMLLTTHTHTYTHLLVVRTRQRSIDFIAANKCENIGVCVRVLRVGTRANIYFSDEGRFFDARLRIMLHYMRMRIALWWCGLKHAAYIMVMMRCRKLDVKYMFE